MSEQLISTEVRSSSTAIPGRTLNTARHNHFVIDSPNGPGEALGTGEAFLAGIAACGVTLVQAAAKTEGISLGPLSVDIRSERLSTNPVDFHRVHVHFRYQQTAPADAETLTEIWKAR